MTADIRALADELELERFSTWGISGGGPHALACAALLRDRVDAAACLASVAPYGAEGLDWPAGMGEDNIEEFGAALDGRGPLERWMDAHVPGLLAADAKGIADELRSLLTPVDAEALTGDLADFLADSMHAAVGERADGWIDDDLAFIAPWGFEPADISVPVQLWQGDEDLFVPPAHGAWLAERIPNVDAHLSPDDGHITLVERRIPLVHAWLLEHATL